MRGRKYHGLALTRIVTLLGHERALRQHPSCAIGSRGLQRWPAPLFRRDTVPTGSPKNSYAGGKCRVDWEVPGVSVRAGAGPASQ